MTSICLLLATIMVSCSGALIVPHTTSYYASATADGGPFADRHLQYHSQDSLGQYSYGYSGGPSSKSEVKTLDGITRGSYSYIDANGLLQTVDYTADAINGFRAAATNLPKAPIAEAQQQLQPVAETAEVAAARAEHMAAYEAALRRDEPEPVQRDDAVFRPRIVTPGQTLLMPQYGWPNSSPYGYYGAPGGGYLMYTPQPSFVRPAGFQYAFYGYHPLANPLPLLAGQQSQAEPMSDEAPGAPGVALLRQADQKAQKRPFVVTDTVAVRAEKLVAKLRKVDKTDNDQKEE